MDIVDRLTDLLKQATTERSHFYVADTCKMAIAEIEVMRMAITHACDVFAEPFGSKNPKKLVGDWRAEMLDAMRALRKLVPDKKE